MFDTPQEKISKWLKKKIEDSERAIDHGWEIEEGDEPNIMIIDTPQMPFKIIVQVDEEITYIAFVTLIDTLDVAKETRRISGGHSFSADIPALESGRWISRVPRAA